MIKQIYIQNITLIIQIISPPMNITKLLMAKGDLFKKKNTYVVLIPYLKEYCRIVIFIRNSYTKQV